MEYSNKWKDLISVFGAGTVEDINQYKYIVRVKAYADMQPRTIAGLGTFRENNDNNIKFENILDGLAERLYSFVVQI